MRTARRQDVLGVVRCGTGPSSRVRAGAPSVQHILRGDYKRGLYAFQGGQRYHGRLLHLRKKTRAGEATSGEPALAISLWGMLYADDAGLISLSLEQPRKMMGVIVVVCTTFGLTVSKAKPETISLRTRGCRSLPPYSA